MRLFRLFFVLVCCLALPSLARAADQNNNKQKEQRKQGQQQHQHAGSQGKHHGANTASQTNNPSQLKGHGQRHGLNTQNNSVPAVQSDSNRNVATKHHRANTTSQHNPSQLKGRGQHHGLNAQNNNLPAVQSDSNRNIATKHHDANTASQLNNPSHVKGQKHSQALNAQNNNVPAVRSNTTARVETRHFNLSNAPNSTIQSATYNQNYRIRGSENWQRREYAAFQNYRGEWHDQGWWHNHYNRIVLISGGWYFWNAGYWAPAWGYDTHAAYYPYNGPIYGYNNLPPDQVIANVQSTLQAQGYYRGEIDGTLGPMTRAALASYQGDHGLYTTEAIDEPTLDSLGMS